MAVGVTLVAGLAATALVVGGPIRAVDTAGQRLAVVALAAVPVAGLLAAVVVSARRLERREERLLDQLRLRQEQTQAIVDCLPAEIAWKDTGHRIQGINVHQQARFATWRLPDPRGKTFAEAAPTAGREVWLAVEAMERQAIERLEPRVAEHSFRTGDGEVAMRFSTSPIIHDGEIIGVVTLGDDITEARAMERALATSGRMESIGQLAAGVAHEINTPIQFVSDNTRFLADAFGDLLAAIERLAELAPERADEVACILAEADVDFLRAEIPQAMTQSQEGLDRVTEIIRAMKDFSHPAIEVGDNDLNRIITSTVAISRNEWKYVADVEVDLDPGLPLVACSEGQMKQVILNLVVNAAQAIADRDRADCDRPALSAGGPKGTIVVRTVNEGDRAKVTVSDDGVGMTPEVRERIFDQFFTTKDVGKGTGQGLSLAWDVIRKHEGSIEVQSAPGAGTTFVITLPLQRQPATT